MFGYAVACPTFCSTNIVDKCTTFGTTDPVQNIATCTSKWCRDWPCFTSNRRCMAGHVVRTGGAHCTKRTTSQAAVKARPGSAGRTCWCRNFGSNQEISQIFAPREGHHWWFWEQALVPGISSKDGPMFVQNLANSGEPRVIWDREAGTI